MENECGGPSIRCGITGIARQQAAGIAYGSTPAAGQPHRAPRRRRSGPASEIFGESLSGEEPGKIPARQGTRVPPRWPSGNASRPSKGAAPQAAARPGAGAKEGNGKSCTVRFYAELNDFLPPGRR